MIRFRLWDLASRIGGRPVGADAEIAAVSTDTRSLPPGALFVALRGERFDGHDFVSAAAAGGAVAAVVDREFDTGLPCILVDDTRLALGRIAAHWRSEARARVVGLTGSNGKTTVKEMIAAALGGLGGVLATRGNLNNDIGVPLTLTRLQDEDFAVIEMGANHPGEIRYLSRMAAPEVALLINAGRAHLEGFGSLEGVARAKAEIIEGLAPGGVFVCPGDSRWTALWRELAAGRGLLTFGTEGDVDVSAAPDDGTLEWTEGGFRQVFDVTCDGKSVEVRLALAGGHNRRNALAAMAVAKALGVDLDKAAAGLAGLRPVPGRLAPTPGRGGIRIIDDTYNANPDSVIAAIRVLAGAPGRRVLVLGDLAELGPDSERLHGELGAEARSQGIDALLTLGQRSRLAADAFGEGGESYQDFDALVTRLDADLAPGDTLLVKGSRSARMERVVDALRNEKEKVAC